MNRLLIMILAFVLGVTACTHKASSDNQNEAAMKLYIDGLNQKDWTERVGFIMTPADFEEFKMLHSQYRNAFPDYHFEPEIILAKGDTVVTIGTVTATHIAELPGWIFKGITPTGKQLQWKEIWVNYLKDGKVVGGYMLSDQLEILHQLGITCPPEEEIKTE